MNNQNFQKGLGDFHFANRIYYEITSLCNLKCIHCSDLFHSVEYQQLAAFKILNFHERLSAIGVLNSVITGGEPTLHPEFKFLVQNLSNFGSVTVTTNGSTKDAQWFFELFEKCPNFFLQISIDGVSQQTFDAIRGLGSYEKVFGLLQGFVDSGYAGKVGLSMTIMQQNLHEVDKLVEYAQYHEIAFLHFPQLVPIGRAREGWEMIAPSVKQQIDIEEKLGSIATDTNNSTKISINRIDHILLRVMETSCIDCLSSLTLKVDPGGHILPCPITSINSFSLGLIEENGQPDLFLKRLTEQIQQIRDKAKTPVEECYECPCIELCQNRFCEACTLLGTFQNKLWKYGCTIIKHHFKNAQKAMEFTLKKSQTPIL